MKLTSIPEYSVTLQLERWRTAVRVFLNEQGATFGDTVELAAKQFDFGWQLGVAVKCLIMTENASSFKYPADWWQAFKERWFPKRWANVKYKKVDVKALYPKLQLPATKLPGSDPVWKVVERLMRGDQ